MKHIFLIFGLGLGVASIGCGAQTLDGGSNEGTSGSPAGSSGSPTPSPGPSDGIKGTPVAGNIDGRPFEPKSIDVYFSKKDNGWFFSMRNYAANCGVMKSPPDPKTSLLVNIGSIEPKAGALPLAYGDKHGATFQIGIYDTTNKAETKSIEDGTLRFDVWDETPGAELAGAIKATSGDSGIEGTFVAKMCAPRD